MSPELQARPAGGAETLSLSSNCTSLAAARRALSRLLQSCDVTLERDSTQIVVSCCELKKGRSTESVKGFKAKDASKSEKVHVMITCLFTPTKHGIKHIPTH